MCGFEAFINGKHIVGEVKEKEQAHREYKEAISKGHGAYLMDEDEETPVRGGMGEGEGSVVMPLIYVFILAELIPIFRQFPLKSLCSCSPDTK